MYIHSCIYEEYKENFTHKNEVKINAIQLAKRSGRLKHQRLHLANKMPDYLYYFQAITIGDELYYKVPPGVSSFFDTTEAFLNPSISFPSLANPLRDYQEEAVNSLLENTTGLLHAKTWTGKTYMMMEIIRRLERKTLIVVHNLTQLKQMVSDVHAILGFYPMYISGEKISTKKWEKLFDIVTVLNIDSHDKITDPDQYGLILFDECHKYMQADARRNWIGTLSPEYMYWLTGTPIVNKVNNAVFDLHFGKRTLVDFTLLEPTYVQVNSSFTYIMDSMDDYVEMETELYGDHDRNKLILKEAQRYLQEGRKWLIFTKRIEHAKFLERELWFYGKTFIMIWETKDEDRMRIRQEAMASTVPCVIIGSTEIIGTWFDLPELSFAILATADQFEWRIIQYVGRLLRPFEWKKDPIFIDITDPLQTLLYRQSKSRIKHIKEHFPDSSITIR